MAEAEYLADFDIDLHGVKDHYMRRKAISEKLKQLLSNCAERQYVELAVGVSDPLGNYSAYEHHLGPKILENNSINAVFRLALELNDQALNVKYVPEKIYKANRPYVKISVGSEIASLLQPNRFWIGNVRTIWSHLVIKHKGDWEKANEELELYRIDDASSEMRYQIWRDIYLSMENSLEIIASIAEGWAKKQGVKSGKLKYIWIDAICNALYESE